MTNVISEHGIDVTVFDKFHHDIIYGKINIRVSLPQSEITIRQMLKILKKQYLTLIGIKFENLFIDEKVAFLRQNLLNIFRNYILNKKI